MYFVVVGAGKIGYSLVKLLLESDNEVVVVEKNSDKSQKISDDFDIISINDDATKEGVLDNANVNEADALISLTESDEVNLIIGMLAKEKGAKKVAVKLSKTNYDTKILTKMGIDLAIHPEAAAAAYIEEVIIKPAIIDLAFLSSGEAELQEILVTKESDYYKKKVKQLMTDSERIIAIFEDKKLKYPKDDYVIKEGDKVLVLMNKNPEEE
jgi:trk system potassium uptake protein TrkA